MNTHAHGGDCTMKEEESIHSQQDLELLDDLFLDDLDLDDVDAAVLVEDAATSTTCTTAAMGHATAAYANAAFESSTADNHHVKRQQQQQQQQQDVSSSNYILGTLIVRVIAARDMKPPRRGHLLNTPQVVEYARGGFVGSGKHGRNSRSSSSCCCTGSMKDSRPCLPNRSTGTGTGTGGTRQGQRRRIIFHRTPSFTFANVTFGNDIQQTSRVEETVNPTWTRSEQCMLFDVSLPLDQLVQCRNVDNGSVPAKDSSASVVIHPVAPVPPALLTLSLYYSDHGSVVYKKEKNNSNNHKGVVVAVPPLPPPSSFEQEHDELVGFATLDVTSVITGKLSFIDTWLPLVAVTGSGGGTAVELVGKSGVEDATGSVRVIVEYDCAESPPRVGDKVRFHGFVESHLCPLPKSQVFRVDHVMGDEVILSFITPVENWKCTFQAHRFMLISVERHVSALERYQEELLNLTLKLANSPAADIVSETVNSLPEEGILFVGMQAAFGGLSLLERWREKGLSTAVEDFVHVTNLDGHQTLDSYDDMNQDISSTEDDSFVASHDDISSLDRSEDVDLDDHDDNEDDGDGDDDESVESGMPCCPITGQPMRRPVVAADGGTYERSAIQRWLRSSDMSPLTGMKLKHKDLIPNYLLISSLQSWKRRSKHHQISQI